MKKRKRGAALALFHEYPLTFPSGAPLQGQPLPSPAPLGTAPSGATPWRASSLGEPLPWGAAPLGSRSLGEPLPWGATPLGSQPPWGVRSLGEPLPWGAKTPLGGPAPFWEQSLPRGAKAPLGGPLPREPPLAGPSSRGTHGFTSLKLFPPAGKMSHLWAVRAPAFPWCIHCRLLARRGYRGARCAVGKSTRIQYAVLRRMPQGTPERPLWDGLQGCAMRLIEEHAYLVCRADGRAAAPAVRPCGAALRGAQCAAEKSTRISMPC